MKTEFSGAQWCARFPTSHSLDDLAEPFRDHAKAFVAAAEAGGAKVSISATLRPKPRGYLMHGAWMIAREGAAPESIAPMEGVDIDWTHGGDDAAAGAAAEAMVEAYSIAYQPSLTSRHYEGRAIDATFSWEGSLHIKGPHGDLITINSLPRSFQNAELQAVAAAYGVHKLKSDPPHALRRWALRWTAGTGRRNHRQNRFAIQGQTAGTAYESKP